jgi:hypothetical protein
MDALHMDLAHLVDLEAIKRLKYRYLRCVDLKLWDEIVETFTEDVSVSYDSGRWACSGRDAVVDMLRTGLGPEVLSSHTVHHPEIDLVSPTEATGVWALQDFVFNRRSNAQLHGAAFYDDRYRKVDGVWRISFTGYTRTFELRHGLEPRWQQ